MQSWIRERRRRRGFVCRLRNRLRRNEIRGLNRPGFGVAIADRPAPDHGYLDRDDISDRQRIVSWLALLRLGTLYYMRRLVGLLAVIWLAIGVVAVGQRGYFGSSPQNCAGVATVAVTVVAGPMNYLGVNPKVKCRLPQPSG